ncbi:MAG: lysophospholipid acyltransferase family protein [Proteobacteria bacterium]|nr:lysophospholipid acyltransferase family protein [Pseudomonadota bacterium]
MDKQQAKIRYSKGLLTLFFMVLFVEYVGYLLVFVFIYILSLIYPGIKKALPVFFCKLVNILIAVQPGLCCELGIKLPKTNRKTLLIANHRSNLDVFSFLAQVPGLRIVANDKLFRIPLFGFLLKINRQIHAKGSGWDSLNQCMKEMRDGMEKREPVLFFPELTRCAKGFVGTSKFLLAPFSLAISEDALIVPLVVSKTDCVWPKGTIGFSYRNKFKSYSLDCIDSREFKTARELAKKCKEAISEALLRDGY